MTLINTSIQLEGLNRNFKSRSLSLHQSYIHHHRFEISVAVPENLRITMDKLKGVLGGKATITFSKSEASTQKGRFVGIVDAVTISWLGSERLIRITGTSPTGLMDVHPRFRTFSSLSLGQILDKVAGNYQENGGLDIARKSVSDQVDWTLQYQHTDYSFLCRLADSYQKLFFYDGEKCYFGDMTGASGPTITLDAQKETDHIELDLRITALQRSFTGFQLEKGELISHRVSGNCPSPHPLVKGAWNESSIFPLAQETVPRLLSSETELKTIAQQRLASGAYELVSLTGSSKNPTLKIGSTISFENTGEFFAEGEYFITELQHVMHPDDSYHNFFKAAPTGFPHPLRMWTDERAFCGPLRAIVKDDKDPGNMGRVKVQFIGDEESTISPWLPTLTPFAGNGGAFSPPAVGDYVLVLFEDFHLDKSPFVLGSFFHGKTQAENWNSEKRGFKWGNISIFMEGDKLVFEAPSIEFLFSKEMKIGDGKGLRLEMDAKQIFIKP